MKLKTLKRFALIESDQEVASRPIAFQRREETDPYEDLEKDITSFAKSSPRYGLMVIAGRAGTGKSTGIRGVMGKLGVEFQDLPRLTNTNAINRDDAKANDAQMKEFQALPYDERQAYVENLILNGGQPALRQEYLDTKAAIRETGDPEEKKQLKEKLQKIFEHFKPKSNLTRLQEMGANPPPYKQVFYIGSQNLNKEQLYFELYRGNGGIIVYDDSNISFWDDKLLQDLLLHAAQTEKVKWVSMPGAAEGYLRTQKGNLFPTKFRFNGKIIIITNRKIKELPANIQTRAIKHDFNPSSAKVIEKTGQNLDKLREDFDEYPPEYVDEVYNWLLQNKSGIKYDFRVFAHLMYLRDQSSSMDDFSQRAKRMLRQFYSAEKDEVKAMRERRIRQALKNYEIARQTQLVKSARANVIKYLKAISDKELADPDLNHTLDLVAAQQPKVKKEQPIGVKTYSPN